MKTTRLTIENKRTTPMLVFIEPEAQDFWFQPGEECEIVSSVEGGKEGYFEIRHTDEGITVFPAGGCGVISVFQSGMELECGHHRPASRV